MTLFHTALLQRVFKPFFDSTIMPIIPLLITSIFKTNPLSIFRIGRFIILTVTSKPLAINTVFSIMGNLEPFNRGALSEPYKAISNKIIKSVKNSNTKKRKVMSSMLLISKLLIYIGVPLSMFKLIILTLAKIPILLIIILSMYSILYTMIN